MKKEISEPSDRVVVLASPSFTLVGELVPMTCKELTTDMTSLQEAAWESFHDRYYDWLTGMAIARGHSKSDPGEIVQQTYLRVARHIKIFQTEEALKNWLVCLMRCVVIDLARQSTRRHSLLEKFSHWQESRIQPTPSSHHDLDGALSKLNPDDAALIRQKYLEGWTTRELAESCQATPKAIESRLARLRKQLKNSLSEASQ
ncbi:MAG: RNA polymerase sigma factor (sigma-70 family) [Paracoccaceae bacterium]